MPVDDARITELLSAVRNGDKTAESRLVAAIYPELRRIARRHMGRERVGHTLQPTALANEAYLRLAGRPMDFLDRGHLLAAAAQAMRQILVDYARSHRSGKRGGGLERVDLDGQAAFEGFDFLKLLALDEALSRLSEWDARQCRIVELRYFGGLTEDEIAHVLALSVRTVKREWRLAKAWLYSQLGK